MTGGKHGKASSHGRSTASKRREAGRPRGDPKAAPAEFSAGGGPNAAPDRPACRADHEPPEAVARLGWRYHHMGIPTRTPRPGEKYLKEYKLYKSGFETSPFGIEWMRFEPACPLPELIRTVAHVAFQVEDLDAALRGRRIIFPPGFPSDGVRSAMIEDNGAPVELIEFCPSPADGGERD